MPRGTPNWRTLSFCIWIRNVLLGQQALGAQWFKKVNLTVDPDLNFSSLSLTDLLFGDFQGCFFFSNSRWQLWNTCPLMLWRRCHCWAAWTVSSFLSRFSQKNHQAKSWCKYMTTDRTSSCLCLNRSQFGPGGEGLYHEHSGWSHEGLLLRATWASGAVQHAGRACGGFQ